MWDLTTAGIYVSLQALTFLYKPDGFLFLVQDWYM